ncbi:MAG: serine/threonine protein kinase [Dehalococcoidia bacterium]|nr:serine/threonine protein kinase [Dehalococcoidia bacterium]
MSEQFELMEQLGRGGMGTVWKARDTKSGEIVALKLLHQMYVDDPDYVARFEREVEIAKRIVSPFVVRTIGFGKRDGVPYVVMEHVAGGSLRERIKRQGPVEWEEAKRIAIQLTTALVAAHDAGVIHRDIKPSNVLLDEDGNVKLADFGIARASDLTRMTGSVTVLGTPAYMSPDGEASVQSDLYALGCVLYELMTGAPPFEGESQQQVLIRHIRELPDVERLPFECRNYVDWLLQKSPAKRPPSAAAFLNALASPASVPQIRHRSPAVKSDRAQPRPHRPRRAAYAALVLGLLAFSGGLLAKQFGWIGSDQPDQMKQGWAIVATEVKAYTPAPGEAAPGMILGPFLYGPDFLAVSFKVRYQCNGGTSPGPWEADVGTSNVRLRTKAGSSVLASGGWGLGTNGGTLACGVDFVGTWIFATRTTDGIALEYAGPRFEVAIPPREKGSVETPLTLDIPQAFIVGQQLSVTSATCLATLVVPAHGTPIGECFVPGDTLRVTAGPVDNLKRWWKLEAPDGTFGWVEQGTATLALSR